MGDEPVHRQTGEKRPYNCLNACKLCSESSQKHYQHNEDKLRGAVVEFFEKPPPDDGKDKNHDKSESYDRKTHSPPKSRRNVAFVHCHNHGQHQKCQGVCNQCPADCYRDCSIFPCP